jgi:hypothetical protein
MADKPQARSTQLSRRMLLRGAVGAAGAAAILDKRCDKCVQFLPPNACKIIEGTISPQGWCRVFGPAPR